MNTANHRPLIALFGFEFLRARYLRRALAKTLKREHHYREAAGKCRAEMADLERRLERAELAAACRVAYNQY